MRVHHEYSASLCPYLRAYACIYACAHLFVYASACVCITCVLCSAICVRTAGPGDPGGRGVVCGEREGEGDRREAQAAVFGINRHYPAVF